MPLRECGDAVDHGWYLGADGYGRCYLGARSTRFVWLYVGHGWPELGVRFHWPCVCLRVIALLAVSLLECGSTVLCALEACGSAGQGHRSTGGTGGVVHGMVVEWLLGDGRP